MNFQDEPLVQEYFLLYDKREALISQIKSLTEEIELSLEALVSQSDFTSSKFNQDLISYNESIDKKHSLELEEEDLDVKIEAITDEFNEIKLRYLSSFPGIQKIDVCIDQLTFVYEHMRCTTYSSRRDLARRHKVYTSCVHEFRLKKQYLKLMADQIDELVNLRNSILPEGRVFDIRDKIYRNSDVL